jgi:hypothetical protein
LPFRIYNLSNVRSDNYISSMVKLKYIHLSLDTDMP